MEIFSYEVINDEEVKDEAAEKTRVRWLITKKRGAANYEMRLFEVGNNGHTPLHRHNWEHEVFVIEGEGAVRTDDKEIDIKSGSVIFIKPNELHQFINKGKTTLKFICVIPVMK